MPDPSECTSRQSDIQDIISQIPDQFLREVEGRLRMNSSHFQRCGLGEPERNNSFSAVYFSNQAKKAQELHEDTSQLSDTLRALGPGNLRSIDHASAIVNRISEQGEQMRILFEGCPTTMLDIAIEKSVSQIDQKTCNTKKVLRRVDRELAGGRGVSIQLRQRLEILIHDLSISLDEIQKYLQTLSVEALDQFPRITEN